MRARRKGTDSPFVQIDRIQLEDSDILYKPDVIEFEVQMNDFNWKETITEDEEYWNELRNRAAISAMKAIIGNNQFSGDVDYVAKIAVKYADALIKQLKEE